MTNSSRCEYGSSGQRAKSELQQAVGGPTGSVIQRQTEQVVTPLHHEHTQTETHRFLHCGNKVFTIAQTRSQAFNNGIEIGRYTIRQVIEYLYSKMRIFSMRKGALEPGRSAEICIRIDPTSSGVVDGDTVCDRYGIR